MAIVAQKSLGNSPLLQLDQENLLLKQTNNLNVFVVRWSVTYFSAPNSPILRKSCGEEQDRENREMQSVLLFKQMQKMQQLENVFCYNFIICLF